MSEVINVNGTIGQADVIVEDGVATVEGFVFCNVLYLSDDPESPIASFTQQIPFTQTFDRNFDVDNPRSRPNWMSVIPATAFFQDRNWNLGLLSV